jgi:hypothetical protein
MALAWLLIAVIFFYFAGVFWSYSRAPLDISKEASQPEGQAGIEASGIDAELQARIESFNTQTMTRYRVGAYGFFIAGLAGLLALYLALT